MRLIEEVDGDLFTLEDFLEDCYCGGLIDYDGFGYYATETHVTDIVVKPSDVFDENFKCDYPNVMWFNR